jgi:hypothetical protein
MVIGRFIAELSYIYREIMVYLQAGFNGAPYPVNLNRGMTIIVITSPSSVDCPMVIGNKYQLISW